MNWKTKGILEMLKNLDKPKKSKYNLDSALRSSSSFVIASGPIS